MLLIICFFKDTTALVFALIPIKEGIAGSIEMTHMVFFVVFSGIQALTYPGQRCPVKIISPAV